jgi:site-specific recombinase XerD
MLVRERGQRQANYALSVLHNVFEFAIERGWTKTNPVTHESGRSAQRACAELTGLGPLRNVAQF